MIPDSLQKAIKDRLVDGGPVYTETTLEHLNHLVVEPWNAYSSLFFFAGSHLLGAQTTRKVQGISFYYFLFAIYGIGGPG